MNIEVATLMNHGCVATPRIEIDGLTPMVAELQISVCRTVCIFDFRENDHKKHRTIRRAACPTKEILRFDDTVSEEDGAITAT